MANAAQTHMRSFVYAHALDVYMLTAYMAKFRVSPLVLIIFL